MATALPCETDDSAVEHGRERGVVAATPHRVAVGNQELWLPKDEIPAMGNVLTKYSMLKENIDDKLCLITEVRSHKGGSSVVNSRRLFKSCMCGMIRSFLNVPMFVRCS